MYSFESILFYLDIYSSTICMRSSTTCKPMAKYQNFFLLLNASGQAEADANAKPNVARVQMELNIMKPI